MPPLPPILTNESEYRAGFRAAIEGEKFGDAHSHWDPIYGFEGLIQAAAYHYLDGEAAALRRLSRSEQAAHKSLDVEARARANLEAIFADGALPVSTAACGWIRMANMLGLDVTQPPGEILDEFKARYGDMPKQEYRAMIFGKSRVRTITGTQSIFLPSEAKLYCDDDAMTGWDPVCDTAIRFDEALRKPELLAEAAKLADFPLAGGNPESEPTRAALKALANFHIERFRKHSRVRYISASLSEKDRFFDTADRPSQSRFAIVMRDVIIPLAKENGLPVFLMPYVRRGVNPEAGASGDCVSMGDVDDLIRFISENPDVSFILTGLHPLLDYTFAFLTRACPNVRIIGFWWGNLNSNEVRRQIQQRMEFVGTAWFGLNSDARILDQILYKWEDYMDDLEHVLATIILPKITRAGGPVTVAGIKATVKRIQDEDALLWTPERAAA